MNEKIRLNLGSGLNKREGYLNVDKYDYGAPDILMDLERTPWKFDDNTVCEIVLNHTLEHLGRDTEVFLRSCVRCIGFARTAPIFISMSHILDIGIS